MQRTTGPLHVAETRHHPHLEDADEPGPGLPCSLSGPQKAHRLVDATGVEKRPDPPRLAHPLRPAAQGMFLGEFEVAAVIVAAHDQRVETLAGEVGWWLTGPVSSSMLRQYCMAFVGEPGGVMARMHRAVLTSPTWMHYDIRAPARADG